MKQGPSVNNDGKIILKLVHDGADSSLEASALSSHHGRDATQNLLKKRYFWPSMLNDVREYIKERRDGGKEKESEII